MLIMKSNCQPFRLLDPDLTHPQLEALARENGSGRCSGRL
jgi:hypothetical protein